MLQELDVVIAKCQLRETIPAGSRGTVVMVLEKSKVYLVDFTEIDGDYLPENMDVEVLAEDLDWGV